MRTEDNKWNITVVGLLGLFMLFDPSRFIGAQHQALPRPGLNVEIPEATIPESRQPVVMFRITDERRNPLDKDGVLTEGTVTLQFIMARIKAGERQYTAYTTRRRTGTVLGTVIQASADSGGAFTQVGPGMYMYRSGTVLPENYDRTATHTVGIYADRDLTHVDGNDYVAQATFDFVPDGRAVTVKRDVVDDAACNKCHNPMQSHKGHIRTVALCVLCHTPQTADPDTGHTVDLTVMVHKIHRGASLPSVQAGNPYQLVDDEGKVDDFSMIRFPQYIQNCQTCHAGSQGANYLTRPSRTVCGSCHDDVDFATGANHLNIVQVNDTMCRACHQSTASTEFDFSIAGAHVAPTQSNQLPGLKYEILRMENTKPGNVRVVFNSRDRAGKPVLPSQLTQLTATFGGPTTDYAQWHSEDVRMATPTGDGNYTYTFATPIPPSATGTYTVGLEGVRRVEITGSNQEKVLVPDTADGVTSSFAVPGQLQARRAVVDLTKCNACHHRLMAHENSRANNVQSCAVCHNPNQTDAATRPADQLPAESVDFKLMIHRIHTGPTLANEHTIFGAGGVAHNYNEVRYPASRIDCAMCHLPGTQLIGSMAGRLPTVNPRSVVNPAPPISTTCIGCHDDVAALVHVAVNTNSYGESCNLCHAEGRGFAVSRVHAWRPDVRRE